MAAHSNKTFATLLAAVLGGVGAHRFYIQGPKDSWAWLHFASLPLSGIAITLWPDLPLIVVAAPLLVSVLASFIETLVIGLTPDDKWDAAHNRDSGRESASQWPLALILVLTLGIGAATLIASIARISDLLFTGGAYG